MEKFANFDRIYWIGGSPCSGKSTISRTLAKRFGLACYEVDASLPRFLPRLDPQRHPTLIRWTATPWDELWMQPPAALLEQAITAYGEHFGLILEELSGMDQGKPLLAEGTALLPGLVQPYLGDPPRAVWVMPGEAFQRSMYPQRGKWVQGILAGCRDPQKAFQNWMDRDAAFGSWVLSETTRLNLPSLLVDGARSIEENAELVGEMLNLSASLS
jgi:hypothetical protein